MIPLPLALTTESMDSTVKLCGTLAQQLPPQEEPRIQPQPLGSIINGMSSLIYIHNRVCAGDLNDKEIEQLVKL